MALRILFLGMQNDFARPVLEALIQAGFDVCGVGIPHRAGTFTNQQPVQPLVQPDNRSLLPIANRFITRTIVEIAWEAGIPVFELSRLNDPAAHTSLAGLQPDIACVACFSLRIPPALLALPPHGFLNVHPALLPAHRGPEPLFWTFRQGDQAGVTVHYMDEGLDTGDIALQTAIELTDGISGAEAEHRCAEAGAQLLVEALQALERGTPTRAVQPPGGNYEPWPAAKDFRLSTEWPARQIFNFMRGTAGWNSVYPITAGEQELNLRYAERYDAQLQLQAPVVYTGDLVMIQCTPGVLWAR